MCRWLVLVLVAVATTATGLPTDENYHALSTDDNYPDLPPPNLEESWMLPLHDEDWMHDWKTGDRDYIAEANDWMHHHERQELEPEEITVPDGILGHRPLLPAYNYSETHKDWKTGDEDYIAEPSDWMHHHERQELEPEVMTFPHELLRHNPLLSSYNYSETQKEEETAPYTASGDQLSLDQLKFMLEWMNATFDVNNLLGLDEAPAVDDSETPSQEAAETQAQTDDKMNQVFRSMIDEIENLVPEEDDIENLLPKEEDYEENLEQESTEESMELSEVFRRSVPVIGRKTDDEYNPKEQDFKEVSETINPMLLNGEPNPIPNKERFSFSIPSKYSFSLINAKLPFHNNYGVNLLGKGKYKEGIISNGRRNFFEQFQSKISSSDERKKFLEGLFAIDFGNKNDTKTKNVFEELLAGSSSSDERKKILEVLFARYFGDKKDTEERNVFEELLAGFSSSDERKKFLEGLFAIGFGDKKDTKEMNVFKELLAVFSTSDERKKFFEGLFDIGFGDKKNNEGRNFFEELLAGFSSADEKKKFLEGLFAINSSDKKDTKEINAFEKLVAGFSSSDERKKFLERLFAIDFDEKKDNKEINVFEELFAGFTPSKQTLETTSADMSRTMLLLNFLTQINHDTVRTLGGSSKLVRVMLSRQPARLVRPIVRFVALMKQSPQPAWRRFLTTMRSDNPTQAYLSLMRMIEKENSRQQFLLKKVKFMTRLLKKMNTNCFTTS